MPDSWSIPALPLAFAVLGWCFLRAGVLGKMRTVAWGWLVFGFLGAIVTALGVLMPYAVLRVRVARGHYELVEGVVEHFVPGDDGDHREESFTVSTASGVHEYHYSPSRIEGGYVQTRPHGGRLGDGIHVRIFDVDGRIAHLELAVPGS